MAGGLEQESETSIFLFSPDFSRLSNFLGDVLCCKLWMLHRRPNRFHVFWDSFFSEMVCISMEGQVKPHFKVSVLFHIGLFCVLHVYFFFFHLTQTGYCSKSDNISSSSVSSHAFENNFWAHLLSCKVRLLALSYLSVHVYQPSLHWMDFHEISHLRFMLSSVEFRWREESRKTKIKVARWYWEWSETDGYQETEEKSGRHICVGTHSEGGSGLAVKTVC